MTPEARLRLKWLESQLEWHEVQRFLTTDQARKDWHTDQIAWYFHETLALKSNAQASR